MVRLTEPWSAKHKRMTKHGSLPYNLSNSYAQPLTSQELLQWARERNDQDLVDAYSSHALDYTPNGGSEDLRTEIAQLYGPQITKDHVLVFTGAQVAVQTAAFAIVGGHHTLDNNNNNNNNNPHHTIVFTPGYQSLQEAPIHAGSQVTRIQLSASNNWAIDLKQVEAAIQPHTRYLVLNEPYNPAGTIMSQSTQDALLQLATQHDLYVLCDEVYRYLEHTPETTRIPALCDVYDKGLSIVTMSKPWGACGVTIGWIATQNLNLMEKLKQVQYFGTACPSRASEIQAIMVLRASDLILDRNRVILLENIALLDQFMQDYHDFFSWVRPSAGAIAFLKFKGTLSSEQLGEELAAVGIGIKPAYCFSAVVTDDVDYFRVGYGERTMPAALEQLRAFVERHKASWKEQMAAA